METKWVIYEIYAPDMLSDKGEYFPRGNGYVLRSLDHIIIPQHNTKEDAMREIELNTDDLFGKNLVIFEEIHVNWLE